MITIFVGFKRFENLSFIDQFSKINMGWPQQPPTKKVSKFTLIFHDSKKNYLVLKHQNKAEFRNLVDSAVISSNFPSLRTFAASMNSTTSTTSTAYMTSTASFHQKKLLILMVGSSLAPKWPILAPFFGMDLQKSNFTMISDTHSVGGCWGQPMLFFWKRVAVPKNSLPQHFRTNLTCISLPVRVNS